MIWGAISWRSAGPMISLHGRINSRDYLGILGDQVHPMVQALFPEGNAIFQDYNAPIHTARIVKARHEEDSNEVEHLIWPTRAPDLNIIEHLWSILEIQVRRRFPPPSSLKELEGVLTEEWAIIPLEAIHTLYESIPRRIEAVIAAKEPYSTTVLRQNMARTTQLSREKRQSIITLRFEGQSIRNIARTLKVSPSAVMKTINRCDETGSYEDRPRKGRPRVTSAAEDKLIKVASLKNRKLTAPQITALINDTSSTGSISTSTVKRRLREAGLNHQIAAEKPSRRTANRPPTSCRKKDSPPLPVQRQIPTLISCSSLPCMSVDRDGLHLTIGNGQQGIKKGGI
ncbi:uncharacterized protein [Dendrobates tinctorius]|uniref:uncharacterized protein n=1 Tax=Dendrobates tinctorius TaxID=92724 RepID=UPI003CC9F9C1